MTTSPTRRRASGMSPEERRETIVRAALPLVSELGAAVTTAQIARAAGIGEATIFRVFDDKDAVLRACIAAALDPTNVLQELRTISLEQPLAARLIEAIDALDAHLGRIGTVIGALHASGTPNRRQPPASAAPAPSSEADSKAHTGSKAHTDSKVGTGREAGTPGDDGASRTPVPDRDASQRATREAVTDLFAPDQETLRLPAETLADAFMGLFFGRGRSQHSHPPAAQLVDLFLHGALTTPNPA